MQPLVFTPFGGVIPRLDPKVLPASAAQVAENCRITSGSLEAFRTPLEVMAPAMADIKTIYRFGQSEQSDTDHWFTFNKIVDVVKGAIANDTEERTYYTGDGYPKVTKANMALASSPYPATYYRLGLPQPATAPTVSVSGSPSSETAIAETRVYIQTFVSVLDEESAPGLPSQSVDVKNGQTVTVFLAPIPSGAYNVTRKRIYRSVKGTSSTQYLFVAEVNAATGVFDDTVLAAKLGEVLPSLENSQLPDDARGLVGMPNGMMAAHTEYDVYFCAPYKPYAWPVGYMQTVDFPIVGISAYGNSLAVLTTGVPYIMTGTDPSSVSVDKKSVKMACMSKRSIVADRDGVIFASADGLVLIDANGIKVITEDLFTRREWSALNPASMLCAMWNKFVFIFYDNGTTKGGYILSSDGLITTPLFATAAYTDTVTGALFLCIDNKIVKWDAGALGEFRWKSRRNMILYPQNVGVCQVIADAYPVTANVYADGELTDTAVIEDDNPVRLSAGFRARAWELELIGSSRVSWAALASCMEDLLNV